MDWLTGIQNAINYIEDHLTEEIDWELAAREAACSSFYFQRIFSILCGMTLGDYIRNRRLSLAGSELQASDQKVIDIALKYGYESPESFARAFVRFHGITPSQAKKDGAKLRSFSRLSVKITLSGGTIMNYKIVEREAFSILEKGENHTMKNGENEKSIPAFWSRCYSDGTVDILKENALDKERLLGVCYGDPMAQEESFRYAIAVEAAADSPIPAGFEKRIIPAGTWVIFSGQGAIPKAISQLWDRILTEFFPTSAYRPSCALDMEVYVDGDTDSDVYPFEIRIPVVKK